jgi:hypothetical protein
MADSPKGSIFSSITPQQVLAILTLLSSTLLLQFQPLQSRREMDRATAAATASDDHKFPASNIEDPLAAIRAQMVVHPEQSFDPKTQVKAHTHWGFFIDLKDRIQSSGPNRPMHLVFAYVRSGWDLPAREQRERGRLAVVSALASCGYVPEAERAMEVLQIAPPTEKMLQAGMTGPWELGPETTNVPFEWFKPVRNGTSILPPASNGVCVLWLDANVFTSSRNKAPPVNFLRRMLHALLTGHPRPLSKADSAEISPKRVEISVLGPNSSDKLSAFLKEAYTLDSRQQNGPLNLVERVWSHPVRMVSPYATASAAGLLRTAEIPRVSSNTAAQDEARITQLMANALAASGQEDSFIRAPLSDDYVAQALVDELTRRGVDLSDTPKGQNELAKGDIVLLSEHDTGYGRELPLSFLAATPGKLGGNALNQPGGRWHWTSFTRGLDGRFSAAADEPANKSSGDGGKKDAGKPAGEEPRGIHQMDALRRLATQLEELHLQRRRQNLPGIAAVGVLGGDVYDKLLILRALKPHLAQTLFFTNNLDTWLWEREELPATRNLIVASPFDLRLGERWQAGKPPFRDSYQTAVYASTLSLLLGNQAPELQKQITLVDDDADVQMQHRMQSVRLFEIGREGPVDISLPPPRFDDPLLDLSKNRLHPDPGSVAPFWTRLEASRFFWFITLLIVVSFGLWLMISNLPALRVLLTERQSAVKGDRRLQGWLKYRLHEFLLNPAWIPLMLILALLLGYRWWTMQREDGEPLSHSDGVSSWPFMMLNLAAVLLAAHLVTKALAIIWHGENRLKRKYFPVPADTTPQAKTPLSLRQRLLRIAEGLLLFWNTPQIVRSSGRDANFAFEDRKDVHPVLLWSAFRHSSRMPYRLLRSLVTTSVICWGMTQLARIYPAPLMPVRGEAARDLCHGLEFWTAFAFVWLGMLVFDSLWLNRIFIHWFRRGKSLWPEAYLKPHLKEEGVRESVCDYLDLRMVMDWTRDLGRLTALPFYVLAVLLIARLDFFDVWELPIHLGVTFGLVVALVITGAYRVHTAAQRLREKALKTLDLTYSPLADHPAAKRLHDEFRSLSEGAFMPFGRQPVMEALYWLVSALSVTGLWQALAQFAR